MNNKLIETEVDRQWLGEDGIVYVEVFPNAEVTLANVQQSTEMLKRMAGGKKRPVLVDNSEQKSMTREAREHMAGKTVEDHALALALVMQSPIGKVLGSLFLGLTRSSFPVRLFTSKDEAIEWLRGFLKEERGDG